jgi:hypothetical protein
VNERTSYHGPNVEAAEMNDMDTFDPLAFDPVIEVYKKYVDRTILRENLKLSPQERSEKFLSFMESVWQLQALLEEQKGRLHASPDNPKS